MNTGFMKTAIAKHGWYAIAVGPTETDTFPPFTYSVGFQSSMAQPDVVVIGMPPQTAHAIIGSLFLGLKSRRLSIPEGGGKMDEVIQKFPVLLRKIDPDDIEKFAYATVNWNDPEPTVMYQIVLPDKNGLFDGDAGVDPNFAQVQRVENILLD